MKRWRIRRRSSSSAVKVWSAPLLVAPVWSAPLLVAPPLVTSPEQIAASYSGSLSESMPVAAASRRMRPSSLRMLRAFSTTACKTTHHSLVVIQRSRPVARSCRMCFVCSLQMVTLIRKLSSDSSIQGGMRKPPTPLFQHWYHSQQLHCRPSCCLVP